MRMDKLEVGQIVASVEFPDEVGEVVALNHESNIVWVRMPIPHHRGQFDEIDLDPNDIQPVEEAS